MPIELRFDGEIRHGKKNTKQMMYKKQVHKSVEAWWARRGKKGFQEHKLNVIEGIVRIWRCLPRMWTLKAGGVAEPRCEDVKRCGMQKS